MERLAGIERSRDATKPKDVKGNYGANTAYLKKVFNKKCLENNL